MSTENEVFTKENLSMYLSELSKEYKRLGGRKMPVEIILIGGAAIIESYGFREMTTDIDAVLPSVSIMKDAINHVGGILEAKAGTGTTASVLEQLNALKKQREEEARIQRGSQDIAGQPENRPPET